MILKLDKPLKNKILFIKFKENNNTCRFGDKTITINGVQNKITCKKWKYYNNNDTFHYVISSNEKIEELVINFSLGIHEISDIETYIMGYDNIKNTRKNVDEFKIDKTKTKGDIIEGDINVSQDKYFNISIPYDKGFTIYVDKEKIEYEKVDIDFIGFKINKGAHHIKIVFEAPLLKVGMITSTGGLVGFISICFIDKKKNNINNKKNIKKNKQKQKKKKKKKEIKKGVKKK